MKKHVLSLFFLLTSIFGIMQSAVAQDKKDSEETVVVMETTMGEIVVRLYDDTPLHRDNFLKLVNNKTYEGLLFHRVINKFMVQAGDPKSKDARPGQMLGDGTLGYTIPAEIRPNHFHKRGALCAARQGDQVNPKRESSASQFYIVQGEVWKPERLNMMQERKGAKYSEEQVKAYTTIGGTPHLDGEYTVFGEVIKGMEVVDRIATVETDRLNRPVEDVRILKVYVKEGKKNSKRK